MTQQATVPGARGYEGTDYVCPNCGCEIMVKHSGDHSKMSAESTYTCRCGTRMELEHPGTQPGM